MFYQTRSNAIILQGTLPAHGIVKVERLKSGEKLYEWQYLSLRPPPKISLRHDLNWTEGNDQSGSTVEHQPVGKLVQQSLGETLQSGSSKPTQFLKHIEDRTGQLVTQEIVGKLQGELSSSDRSGQPDREEEKRVLKSHDRTEQPVKGRLHKFQEDGYLKNRDDADKFNLSMDDENIDFNISGIPDATVKRSKSISVHDLIQKIESHPQKEAIQNDLEQHRPFNPFSAKSKVAIMAAGNTELCEIINVEPKLQCKACPEHCSTGIIYCTCGHLMTNDSAENRKYISAVLDTFSIPNFYIKKGGPHGHRYGEAPGCKKYHAANQLARKCRKKKYDSIHDRFIRDKTFRKAMIEVGRSEKIIKETDQLASENHTHNATRAEINVYSGNWWIHSNVVNFDKVPTRHQPDFKKALSTMYRLKQAEDEKQYAKWSQSSSSWWQLQTNWWESDYENSPQRWKNPWLNRVTRYLVANYSFAVGVSARIEFKNFIVIISVTAHGSQPSPTGGVNTIHPAPEIHEHLWFTKATEHCAQPQAHFHLHWDHCDQLREQHNAHWRVHRAALSTLRAVFRCVALTCSHCHIGSRASQCLSISSMVLVMRIGVWASSSSLSFYLLLKFLFHLFLIPAMVPEDSMNNPLCHSAIGSMVTFDYCTPDTHAEDAMAEPYFVLKILVTW